MHIKCSIGLKQPQTIGFVDLALKRKALKSAIVTFRLLLQQHYVTSNSMPVTDNLEALSLIHIRHM